MEIVHLTKENSTQINIPIVAMIGAFDGFHKGHLALVEQTLSKSNTLNIASAIITFYPNPKHFIDTNRSTILLSDQDKIDMARSWGFDYFIIIDFDYQLRALESKCFVDKYLVANCVDHIICGFDYRYGRGQQSSGRNIESDSNGLIQVTMVSSVDFEGEKISSSRIHFAIKSGDIDLANNLLGYKYMMNGFVVHGNKIGRTLGYPTANISLDAAYELPKFGVYGVSVLVDGKYHDGICNIGIKPTLENAHKITVEVHILEFNRNIYGRKVKIIIDKFIRNEQKFKNLTLLKGQIVRDIEIYKSLK